MADSKLDQIKDDLEASGVPTQKVEDILLLVRHAHKHTGADNSHAAQNRAERYAQMLLGQGVNLEPGAYVRLVRDLSEYFMSDVMSMEGA